MKTNKKSDPQTPVTPKTIRAQISRARAEAELTAQAAKAAKAGFKAARKAFKQAKKTAKQARKNLKALSQELEDHSARRVQVRTRKKPAKDVAPAPPSAPVAATPDPATPPAGAGLTGSGG